MTDYELRITRRTTNPAYREGSTYSHEPQYLEHNVTLVTLDAEQWTKVQAAIVESLKTNRET